jgi:tetratricopeptide (TPR) repeat protein
MAGTADRLFTRALGCHQAGDARSADALCRKALRLAPAHADALNLLGVVCLQAGQAQEGLSLLRKALAIAPGHVQAHNNLGNALAALQRSDEAIAAYRQALALAPGHASAFNNLGNVLRDTGRHEEAAGCYRRALALQPRFAQAHNNLGNVLLDDGQAREAAASYRQALAAQPDYADAYCNLGNALRDLGLHDEAMACYVHALDIQPGLTQALWNRSHLLLAQGRFAEGWPDYEERWRQPGKLPLAPTPFPLWRGDTPLTGRSLLLQAEQGLGDAIQMMRYVPLLQARGARCWLQVPQPLLRLAARSLPGAQVIAQEATPQEGIDLRLPMMSLPLAMRTFSEDAIPAPRSYLQADPVAAEGWRHRLGGGQPLVGLAWRGNPGHRNDRRRSAALADLLPLCETLPQVRFVSLQKSLLPQERECLAPLQNVQVLDRELQDLDDTAAVMAGLDTMVSVDSAPAHLAAALGVPTWLLLPFHAEWRWQIARPDSPWYPSARLARQQVAGDWSGPRMQVAADLVARARTHTATGCAAAAPLHSLTAAHSDLDSPRGDML